MPDRRKRAAAYRRALRALLCAGNGRLALEAKLAAIAESQAAVSVLAGLRDPAWPMAIGLLREIGDRYGVVGVSAALSGRERD